MEGIALPDWVKIYLAIGFVCLVHEKSPIHEWAKDRPLMAFLIFFTIPLVLLSKLFLGVSIVILFLFLIFSFFRKDNKKKPKIHLSEIYGSDDPSVPNLLWPYLDICIYFANNYEREDLTNQIRAFRSNIGLKYPGEFDPPEWLSFDGLSDNYPREQSIYDILYNYIIDDEYPNSLLKDGLELTAADALKVLPEKVVEFFRPLGCLTNNEYEEMIFVMAMYKAFQFIEGKRSRSGVNHHYQP
jgi:hypothetical protein